MQSVGFFNWETFFKKRAIFNILMNRLELDSIFVERRDDVYCDLTLYR